MSKSLKFSLTLATDKARKDLKNFVKEAKQIGKGIKITPAVSKAASEAAKPVEKATKKTRELQRMLDKALMGVDRLSAKYGDTMGVEIGRIERKIRRAFLNMSSGQMSQRGFTRLVMREINGFNDTVKAHKKANKEKESDDKRSLKQRDKDAKKARERDEKNLQRLADEHEANVQKEADRLAKAAAAREEAIAKIKRGAAADLNKIDHRAGVANIQNRKMIEAEIRAIIANSADMQVDEVRAAVAMMMIEYQKLSRAEVRGLHVDNSEAMRQQAARAKQQSRNMQMLFNAQQIMEDFSFAGLKGVTNNISAMAAGLGGPAGLVVMLGTMALTLPGLAQSMGLLGEETDDTNEELKEQAELYRHLKDIRMRFRSESRREPIEDALGDMKGKKRDLGFDKADLKDMRDARKEIEADLANLRQVKKLEEEIAKKREALSNTQFNLDRVKREQGLTGDRGRVDAALRQQIKDLEAEKNATIRDLANRNPELDSADDIGKAATKLLEELTSKGKDATKAIKELEEEIALTEELLKGLEKVGGEEAFKAFDQDFEIDTKDLSEAASSVESIAEQYDALVTAKEEALAADIEMKKEAALDAANAAKARGDYEEAVRILKDAATEMGNLQQDTQDALDASKELADTYGETYKFAEDLSDATKDAADNAKQHLETLKEQVKELRKARRESRQGFEGEMHSAKSGVIDMRFDRRAEALKAQDEMMIRRRFGKRKGVDEFINRRAEMIDRQVETERHNAQNRHLFQRQDQLMGRAEFAEQAGNKTGDFSDARSALEEVQGLLMDRAASVSDPNEAMNLLRQAEEVQKEIERLYEKEARFKEEEAEKTQDTLDDLKGQLDTLEGIMKGIDEMELFTEGDLEKAKTLKQDLKEMLELFKQLPESVLGDVKVPEGPDVASAGLPVGTQRDIVASTTPGSGLMGPTVSSSVTNQNFNVEKMFSSAGNVGALKRDLLNESKARAIQMA